MILECRLGEQTVSVADSELVEKTKSVILFPLDNTQSSDTYVKYYEVFNNRMSN